MLIIDHDEEKGWHDARIVPYQPLELDPAAMVFHYAMESFEGLKAYRTPDGSIQLFRPDKNAQRMINTNHRMCLPSLPVEDFVQAVKAIVEFDQELGTARRGHQPLHPSVRHRDRAASGRSHLPHPQVHHRMLSGRR